MNILLDTNIIVDALASRTPFDKAAKEILLLWGAKKCNCAITASTASDIYYIVGKYLKDEETVRKRLKTLFSIIDIVSVDKTANLANGLPASCANKPFVPSAKLACERFVSFSSFVFPAPP